MLDRATALQQVAQHIQEFKDVLPEVIQDSTLNKDGEYASIDVPNQPVKTMARGYWNLLTQIEKYRADLDNYNWVQKYAKGAALGIGLFVDLKKIEKIAHKEYGCEYTYLNDFDPKVLFGLPGESNSLYIHVIRKDKIEKLFYVNKKKKTCIELPPVKGLFDKVVFKEPRILLKKHTDKILAQVNHEYHFDINQDVYLLFKAARKFLKAIFDESTGKYHHALLSPAINQVRDKLPIDLFVKFLKKNLDDELVLDTYLDVNNMGALTKRANGEMKGTPSVNVDINKAILKLDKYIARYEAEQAELKQKLQDLQEISSESDDNEKSSTDSTSEPISDTSEEVSAEKDLNLVEIKAVVARLENEQKNWDEKTDKSVFKKAKDELSGISGSLDQMKVEVQSAHKEKSTKLDNEIDSINKDLKEFELRNESNRAEAMGAISQMEKIYNDLKGLQDRYDEIVEKHANDFFITRELNINEELNSKFPLDILYHSIGKKDYNEWNSTTRPLVAEILTKMCLQSLNGLDALRSTIPAYDKEKNEITAKRQESIKDIQDQVKSLNDANDASLKAIESLEAQRRSISDNLDKAEAKAQAKIEADKEETRQAAAAAKREAEKKAALAKAEKAKAKQDKINEERQANVKSWDANLDAYLKARNKKYKKADAVKKVTANTIGFMGGTFFKPGYRDRRTYIQELHTLSAVFAKNDTADNRQNLLDKVNDGLETFRPRAKEGHKRYEDSLHAALMKILNDLGVDPQNKFTF